CQLRWELTRELGVAWGPLHNSTADIAGFNGEVLREFSHRRVEIEAHLEAHGETSAKAAQFAAYATRQAKDPDATPENLHAQWRTRAETLGLNAQAIERTLDRAAVMPPPAPGSTAAAVLYAELAGPDGLTQRRSTFGRGDVITAICDR